MGIEERRQRERRARQEAILRAAWEVAEELGWARFSVEKVAARAELGRATIYGYFESLEVLVLNLAAEAIDELNTRVAEAPGLAEALDVPVRIAQQRPAAFALLFPDSENAAKLFASPHLDALRSDARTVIGRLKQLATRSGASLPEDAKGAAAFISGISIAGAMVPELRDSTTLRRRWQDFCLGLQPTHTDSISDDAAYGTDTEPAPPLTDPEG
ncbi:MAG: helix-turn-helix transcriptional regulator [Polyangiaceae bacterium]|nr:helix-turn-helix transcriptional regulator [Polyangiaceae bacterium]MCW5792537.1 helix-turn-helix transcriptional regulator [Polyangiaceae bacterium]